MCKSCIAKRTHKSWMQNRTDPMWNTRKKLRANFKEELREEVTNDNINNLIARFGNRSALSGRVAKEGEMLNMARWDNARDWDFCNMIPITKAEMWSHTQHAIIDYPRGLVNHIEDIIRKKPKSIKDETAQHARLPPALNDGMSKDDQDFLIVKHFVNVYECLPPWFLVLGPRSSKLFK